MKAEEFIKKFGLEKVKNALNNAPQDERVWYFYWCRDCGHGGSSVDMLTHDWDRDYCACPKCNSENLQGDEGDFYKLNRLVESYNVVEKLGGIESASKAALKENERGHIINEGLILSSIRDVKACQ